MTTPILAYEAAANRPRYFSIPRMAALAFAGLLLPLPALALCWLLAVVWTGAGISHHLIGLYDPLSAFPLVALTLLAMACFAWTLFAPASALGRPVVRWGVYLCPLINLVYLAPLLYVLVAFAGEFWRERHLPALLVIALFVYVIAPALIITGIVLWKAASHRTLAVCLLSAAALILVAALPAGSLITSLFDVLASEFWAPVTLGIFVVPFFWPLAANITMAVFVLRHSEQNRAFEPALAAGAVALASASSFALVLMDYSPTGPGSQPIRCFVASAAARGHRRWVRARPMPSPWGMIPVNDQLRVLIAAELAVKVTHPRLHRLLRGVYNGVGPVLARLVCTRLTADAAYVALKPCEVVARAIVRGKLGDLSRLAHLLLPVAPE